MTEYCEICGEELDPDDEENRVCKNCRKMQAEEEEEDYEEDEEYIDPGIT